MRFLWFAVESLWFFLPAFAGNQFPGFAAKFFNIVGRPQWNLPVWEKKLGKNKTWPAYPAAILGSVITIYLQRKAGWNGFIDYSRWDLWLVGTMFGFGIVAGDQIKSFFKRRRGIKPGDRWWPFDELDYVFGGFIALMPFVGTAIVPAVFVIAPIVLTLKPLVNGIGYRLGLREVTY